MEKLKFKDQGSKILLKNGNKILGFLAPEKTSGYSYNIGKPSDFSVACFTANRPEGFTLQEAKNRLLEAVQ